ncbi:MAG: STAS domain-containing protein [Ferruginibacter sp.]
MNVKIDTKEKFSVLLLEETDLSANMSENLTELLRLFLSKPIPHLILSMKNVQNMDKSVAQKLSAIQQEFYEKNCSFVICELNKSVEIMLDELGLLEYMNYTPTESEAWDIVQMEEIERELLGDFDENTV